MITKKKGFRIFSILFVICFGLSLMNISLNAQVNDQYMRVPADVEVKTEKMVDRGQGRKLHCKVYGKGSPCVVLVSGFMAPQSYWNAVIPELSEISTIVTYDRPGIGKSEKGDLPMHIEQSVKDLHAILTELNAPKPYILVGHSFGVHIVRLYASIYPDDMGGLILEDGSHESLLEEQLEILKGEDLEILKQHVPSDEMPENPRSENDYRGINNKLLKNSDPLPRIPFVVITAGNRANAVPPFFSEPARKDLIELGMKLQQKLVDLIPGGKHVIAEGIGHNIHVEKPEILVEEIIEMINKNQAHEND